MSWFKHLPVRSEQDTTQNFEQLQPIVENLVAQEGLKGPKQLVTVGGLSKLKWTSKSVFSGEEKHVQSGLLSITSVVMSTLNWEGEVLPTSVVGGNFAFTGVARIVREKGVELGAYWIAIGYNT